MDNIVPKFERMGARVKIHPVPVRLGPVVIDIERDKDGEYFDVGVRPDVDLQVVDVQPKYRHLLLLVRDPAEKKTTEKSKFLCGHDERHWFVAAVPEVPGVRDVQTAMDALKPPEVWQAIEKKGVSRKAYNTRHNDAFVRQGEWFFIPVDTLNTRRLTVLHHEPISRGRGKSHWCEYLARSGGQTVMVSPYAPTGLTVEAYENLDEDTRKRFRWRAMQRDATVYVRGYVRHPDHKTIWLRTWHRVVMNTEARAKAMAHVAFLD